MVPPAWIMELGTETYVRFGMVTSPTLRYLQERNNALVQESTATAMGAPVYSATASSNLATILNGFGLVMLLIHTPDIGDILKAELLK